MIRSDLHVHTTYSDGKNTPEEMILAAIGKGMTTIGISDHSYTAFDESYCLQKEKQTAYFEELTALKEKYAGKIEVKIGLELDRYSALPPFTPDYMIGSAHYVKHGETYLPVDASRECMESSVRRFFGGDAIAFAEAYYRTVGELAEKPIDIVGHFDLVTKFNEHGDVLDETDPRYRAAWRDAAEKLLRKGLVFEINTGAVARGYRTTPYPSAEIRNFLAERGARFVLSGDSHETGTLLFAFDAWEAWV